MFIGHFAVGFASKRWAPRTSLGLLLAAPLLLDLLWPIFSLLGLEHFRIVPSSNPFTRLAFDSYPWSHSLLMALVWGAVLAALYRRGGGEARVAGILALGVVSHWVLDWVTHLGDMPLWPDGPRVGLALWNSVPATVAVESAMLLTGAWLYFGATHAKDRIGAVGAWAFLLLMAALYAQSIVGPPPPTGAERLLSLVALVAVLLVPLAAWVDRHRAPTATGSTG